jgi:hypothetical protein
MMLRSFFVLLLWSIPGIIAHAQTVYFISAADTLYVGNAYYEVALLKANGSLISIKEKTSNQFISTATTVENLWRLEFYNNLSLLSNSFRSDQANSFSYAWDASASRLSLQYDSNPASVRRVSVTVTLEPSQSSYLDLSLQVQNNYMDTLSTVGFPNNLSFRLTDIQEAVLPVMPGIKFNQQFFTQKRSWLWGDYPRNFVFADYIFFRTRSSTLSMYHIVEDNLTPTVRRPLFYEQNSQGEFYRFGHDFEIIVPSGTSYRTPRVRIRVGEAVVQNVENFRNDAGLNATPSTREKLGSLYEKVASAYVGQFDPSGNLSGLGLRLSNREGYKTWLSQIPSPALLFFIGWQERGGDENNPDWFPVDASLGTTDDLRAMSDNAKQLGHLLLPYMNPTFWDDESPTMRMLNPLQVAILDNNGNPKIENYGTKGGYGVCPYSPFVLDRLERALQEFRQYIDPHLIFQDQVGARYGLDFNAYEPKPWALAQGWREYSLRFKSNNWVTEFGYDRLVSSHVGFWWSTVPEDYRQWGDFGNASWGRDTWEYFPIVHMMARDKIFFYNAADYQVQSKLSLSWCMGMGLFLSSTLVRDLPAPAKKAWLYTISDFQKYAIAPYAHERVRNYTPVADSVTSTRFETHSILVNWSKSNTYHAGQYILSKEGCLVTSDDGRLIAGIFTRFNGKDLTAGDHFLIVRQFADSIVVHHPQGPSTKLSLTIPPNWGTNPDVHVYAFTNDVTSEGTKTVAGGIVEFDLKDSVNSGLVLRYTVAIGPVYLTSPELLLPTDDAEELSRAPVLSWNPVLGATSYSVELALKSSFSPVLYSRTVSQSNQVQLDTLGQGTTYFWRVRAEKGSSVGTWSETRRFRTAGNNLSDGLVAYFPLNGNAEDFAGNSNNGLIRNGVQPAADRFGVAGRAYDFNGTDGYIEFPESPSVFAIEKEVSVAVWVKPRSYKQEAGVMLRDQSWNLLLQNGQAAGLIFDENGNQNRTSSSQQAPLNTWSHIAFTYDGSTIRVYMNGQQTGQLAFAASRIGNINVARNPTLGKGIGNNQHYFDGAIDEVFIYNRRLSDAELAILAQRQGLVPPALQSPGDGDTVVTRTPLLNWLAVPDAEKYHLQLSLNPGFSSFVFQDSTLMATSVKAPLLALDTTYYWRMRAMSGPMRSDWSSVKSFRTSRTVTGVEKTPAIPKEFALLQNYPNPFNPSTTISYSLPKTVNVTLRILNTLGQEVAKLVDGQKSPGYYQVEWNANAPSGTYFYQLQAGDFVETKKMIIIR